MTKTEMYLHIKRMHFPKQKARSYMGMLRNMTEEEGEIFVTKVCELWR